LNIPDPGGLKYRKDFGEPAYLLLDQICAVGAQQIGDKISLALQGPSCAAAEAELTEKRCDDVISWWNCGKCFVFAVVFVCELLLLSMTGLFCRTLTTCSFTLNTTGDTLPVIKRAAVLSCATDVLVLVISRILHRAAFMSTTEFNRKWLVQLCLVMELISRIAVDDNNNSSIKEEYTGDEDGGGNNSNSNIRYQTANNDEPNPERAPDMTMALQGLASVLPTLAKKQMNSIKTLLEAPCNPKWANQISKLCDTVVGPSAFAGVLELNQADDRALWLFADQGGLDEATKNFVSVGWHHTTIPRLQDALASSDGFDAERIADWPTTEQLMKMAGLDDDEKVNVCVCCVRMNQTFREDV
jgi:hypothetical protein